MLRATGHARMVRVGYHRDKKLSARLTLLIQLLPDLVKPVQWTGLTRSGGSPQLQTCSKTYVRARLEIDKTISRQIVKVLIMMRLVTRPAARLTHVVTH